MVIYLVRDWFVNHRAKSYNNVGILAECNGNRSRENVQLKLITTIFLTAPWWDYSKRDATWFSCWKKTSIYLPIEKS